MKKITADMARKNSEKHFKDVKREFMNRIKEIGIYRALGVSKKNFIFKSR